VDGQWRATTNIVRLQPDFSHGLHVSHDSIICTPQSTRLPKIFSYSPFDIFPFPSCIFTVTVPRLVENIAGFLVAISGSLPTEGNQKKNITTFLSFFSKTIEKNDKNVVIFFI